MHHCSRIVIAQSILRIAEELVGMNCRDYEVELFPSRKVNGFLGRLLYSYMNNGRHALSLENDGDGVVVRASVPRDLLCLEEEEEKEDCVIGRMPSSFVEGGFGLDGVSGVGIKDIRRSGNGYAVTVSVNFDECHSSESESESDLDRLISSEDAVAIRQLILDQSLSNEDIEKLIEDGSEKLHHDLIARGIPRDILFSIYQNSPHKSAREYAEELIDCFRR